MKRRYTFVLIVVVALLLAAGVPALAEPADPPQAREGPAVRVGVAWGTIVRSTAAAHNFVRPTPEEMPTFTLMPGTTVRVMAGAKGLWLGDPGGTLSADLEVYARDAQGATTLLGEDHVSDTRHGPAFEQHPLRVPVSFDQPGAVHLIVRLTATAEPQEGEVAQDVDELEANVIVLDPSTFGSISGQVTANDSGAGLEGLPVTAGSRELRIHRTARTDEDGNYTVEGLPPGNYIVGVQARGTAYVGELYDDAHSPDEATQVTVTASTDTPGIDFGLDRGAEVSGVVTDQETGEPLAGIPIVIRPARSPEAAGDGFPTPASSQGESQAGAPGEPAPSDGRQRPHPAAVTANNGTYTVQGMPAGEYIVAAVGTRQGHGVEFWQEAATADEATPIAVELGQPVSGINFTLEPQSR